MGHDLSGLTGDSEYGLLGTHGNQSMEDIAESAELQPENQIVDPLLNASVGVPYDAGESAVTVNDKQ